jgi:hypothetical protein
MGGSLLIFVVVQSAAHKDAVEFKGRPGSRGDSTRPGWSGIGRGASPFYHQSHGKGLHTISMLSIFLALLPYVGETWWYVLICHSRCQFGWLTPEAFW